MPNIPRRSPELEAIINRMMKPFPSQRITVQKILKNPKVTEILRYRTSQRQKSKDSMELESPESLDDLLGPPLLPISRYELRERKRREEQRRESLEKDMGKTVMHDEDDLEDNLQGIAPKNLQNTFDKLSHGELF